MDRYYRIQEAAFRERGPTGPADPGFKPMNSRRIEELRHAQEAWVEAGRPEFD